MMVKVCGITRRQDAEAAVEAGASAIGFIFYPKSPRYVTPSAAAALGEGLDILKVGVFVDESPAAIESVMQAANLDIAQIYGGAAPKNTRVWKAFRPTPTHPSAITHPPTLTHPSAITQPPTLTDPSAINQPLTFTNPSATHTHPSATLTHPSATLTDMSAPEPRPSGSGQTPITLTDAAEAILLDGPSNGIPFDWTLARTYQQKIILAGGLDASNVAEAIRIAQPWGVDASSKLESAPGIKDHEKVRAFIRAAQVGRR